jgi:S-DNA-T family DNA segregation ATPase FtsK/SpoIIIE
VSASRWELPTLDLLSQHYDADDGEDRTEELLEVLSALGATCNLSSMTIAPQVVRYELEPARGIRMKDFKGIEADVMQQLGCDTVRIEAPTPGLKTVGVELPRKHRATVHLSNVIEHGAQPLRAALGVDIAGEVVTFDIAAAPHMLIAGRSGGGKSVLLHSLLASLLMTHTPDELELIIIDPKSVEGAMYEGLPHASNIIYETDRALRVLDGLIHCMSGVYEAMREFGARNIDELNEMLVECGEQPIRRRVIVIDEFADLIMQSKSRVESAIVRLGQLGRAAGFHMIIATQSPRAQVVTGLLKANLPARIALSTTSAIDSRIILDESGAEDLLGKGDALLDDGSGKLRRFQSAWAASSDIEALIQFWVCQTKEGVAA